jgi:hypothetical protein
MEDAVSNVLISTPSLGARRPRGDLRKVSPSPASGQATAMTQFETAQQSADLFFTLSW